jgi:hypothetical protein
MLRLPILHRHHRLRLCWFRQSFHRRPHCLFRFLRRHLRESQTIPKSLRHQSHLMRYQPIHFRYQYIHRHHHRLRSMKKQRMNYR